MAGSKNTESEVFSFSRFGCLFGLHIRDRVFALVMPLLLFLAAFSGVCYLLFYSSSGLTPESLESLKGAESSEAMLGALSILGTAILLFIVISAAFIMFCIYASMSFSKYHQRSKATLEMMMPCSMLEKFLVPLLLYVFLVPLVYGGITAAGLGIGANHLITGFELENGISNVPEEMKSNMLGAMAGFFRYFLMWPAVFFAGSIWLKQYAFIKTVGVLIVFYIVLGGFGLADVTVIPESVSSDPENMAIFSLVEVVVVMMVMVVASWFKFRRHVLP